VVIVISPTLYKEESRLFRKYQKKVIIGIHTEQLPTNITGGLDYYGLRNKEFSRFYNHYDFIFDFHRYSVQKLHEKGFDKIDYLPYLAPVKNDMGYKLDRKYDLVFLGDINAGRDSRRKRILEQLKENFSFFPKSDNVWGDEKKLALGSSKISLNLHVDNSLIFESPRFFDSIANGALVVSEPILDSYPFKDGRDYISVMIDNMVSKISYLLQNESILLNITQNAENRISEITATRLVDRVLTQANIIYYSKVVRPRFVRRAISRLGNYKNEIFS